MIKTITKNKRIKSMKKKREREKIKRLKGETKSILFINQI